MKKLLFSRLFIFCILISIFIGFLVGIDIKNDFINLYAGKMSSLIFRYTFLVLIVFISSTIFNRLSNPVLIARKKTFYNVFMELLKNELLAFTLLYTCQNIPICMLNFHLFINNIDKILVIIINLIVVSTLISTIISFIDIWVKKRVFSNCIFLIIFSLIDFLTEYYNYFIFEKTTFDFQYIFSLPLIYKNYVIILVLIVLIICLLTSIIISLSQRKDYFLRNETM